MSSKKKKNKMYDAVMLRRQRGFFSLILCLLANRRPSQRALLSHRGLQRSGSVVLHTEFPDVTLTFIPASAFYATTVGAGTHTPRSASLIIPSYCSFLPPLIFSFINTSFLRLTCSGI